MKNSNNQRFRDPNSDYLSGLAWVICPRCTGPAKATGGAVACTSCSFSRVKGEPKFLSEPRALRHVTWQPRCVRCGSALPKIARKNTKSALPEVSISCPACSAVANYAVRQVRIAFESSCDPVSGLPYYLSLPFGTKVLWVRNPEHLSILETYVAATLRERTLDQTNRTWLARLPAWIKAGHNRQDLLKALARLRAKLPHSADCSRQEHGK